MFTHVPPSSALAHLVQVGRTAFQQHEREVAVAARLVGGLGFLVGHLVHGAVGVVFELDHQQVGRRRLVCTAQLAGQVFGHLHRKPHEIAFAPEIRMQLPCEQAAVDERAAFGVQVAERLLRVAGDVALDVPARKVELFGGVHVHARHEVEDVQDRVVDLHGGAFSLVRLGLRTTRIPETRVPQKESRKIPQGIPPMPAWAPTCSQRGRTGPRASPQTTSQQAMVQ